MDDRSHINDGTVLDSNLNSFEVLFDGNPQPMWIFDLGSLAFLNVNRAAEILYGYTSNEFLQMTIADIRPIEDVPKLMGLLNSLNEEFNKIGAVRHRKKNGDFIYVLLHTHDIVFCGKLARHVMITDVTGQIEAENSQKESESKFHVLFDTMLQGVVYQGPDGVIVDANPAAQRIFGLSLEQMKGHAFIDLHRKTVRGDGSVFPGGEHPSMMALATGKPIENHEMGVYNPLLGKCLWILVSAIPLFEPGVERPYAVYATFTDITAQKELEHRLSAEITRRNDLFSKSVDGMVVISSTRRVVEANQSFANMLGYGHDELLALSVWDWDYVYDTEAKTLAGYPELPAQSGFMATKARKKDDTVIDVEVTWWPLEWNNQSNLICIFRDVTERKIVEQNLRMSEERFQKIFSANPAAISLINPETGILLDVNPGFERLFECSRETVVGQSLTQLGLVKSKTGAPDALAQMKQQVHRPPYELSARTTLGKHLSLMHAVEMTSVHGQDLIISIAVDITAQRQAANALKLSEEKYKFIAESIEDVIWVMDLVSFRFDYVSPSVEKLRGFTAEEVMSVPVDEALTLESAQKVKTLLTADTTPLMAGDNSQMINVTEVDQPTKDGGIVHTEVVTTIINDEEGTPSKIFGVSRNISYRRKVEKRRAEAFKLLDICNHATTVEALVLDVIRHMIEVIGCENVSFMANRSGKYPQFKIDKGKKARRLVPETSNDPLWGDQMKAPSDNCICFNIVNGFPCRNIQHTSAYGSMWVDGNSKMDDCEQFCHKNTDLYCAYKQRKSVLWIPVKSGNNIIGLLQLDDSRDSFFDADAVGELESMANYVGISLVKLNSEQEMHESALFLNQVIMGANEGIVVFDVNRRIQIWNPYMVDMTGLKEEDVIGQIGENIFAMLCPDDVSKRIEKALNGERNEPLEYFVYNTYSNLKMVVWDVLTPLYNTEGKVNGAIGVIRNITKRKKAENQAQTFSRLYATLSQVNQAIARTHEKYELYQIICDVSVEFGKFNLAWIGEYNANDHTVVPVASKGIHGVSVPFDKFYLTQPPFDKGITREAIFSRNVAFCKDILKDEGMAHWQDVALKGRFHSVAAIPLFLNGDVVSIFSLYASDVDFFNTSEEADLIREMGLDISYALDAIDAEMQRLKAVDELNQTSERLALATKAAQIGVWDWDLVENKLVWNDVMYRLYGLQPYEDIDLCERWPQFVAPEDRARVDSVIQNISDAPNVGEIEFKITLRTGESRYIRSSWMVMRDQHGRPTRMTGINTDITSRIQATHDRIAREAAEQANKAKSEFLANMSHEIRTPMNSIIGFSELLHKAVADPKHRQQIESIRASSKSLLTIINDILDLSKIDAGKMNLESDQVDFCSVLAGIKQMFSEKLLEKNLPLNICISPNVPRALMLDETRLNQILINLVGNAIKFTNKGEVRVDVEAIEVGLQNVDLVIRVKDTGIGISKEEQALIFDPFYQTKGHVQKKYGGTGLGLAITQRLIEMMGGTIGLESEPGKGTEFSILLPHVEFGNLTEEPVVEDKEFTAYQFEKGTVLVVDDNAENRHLLSDILSQYSLEVVQASNGLEAVAKAVEIRPDLVLMDLRMPEMNGYEASNAIKGNKTTVHIPIVAISASPDVKTSSRINALLFDDFLIKPISIPRLLEVLTKFLKHSEQFGEDTMCEINDALVLAIVMNEELKQNLNKLIRSLETKYLSDYYQAVEAPNVEHIEVLGKELELAGQTSGCEYLAKFGKKLAHLTEIENLAEALTLLAEFPSIIDELKELQRTHL
ncbi:MAG: PAS domain S-box protein [Breznakibacter sp.]